MANEKNLIPNSMRSAEEVRENSRKGGINSGISRRNKRDFKAVITDVLNGKIVLSDDEMKLYGKLNLSVEDSTVRERIAAALILNALKGDLPSLECVLKLTGEDPLLKLKADELALKRKQAKGEAKAARIEIDLRREARGEDNAERFDDTEA